MTEGLPAQVIPKVTPLVPIRYDKDKQETSIEYNNLFFRIFHFA